MHHSQPKIGYIYGDLIMGNAIIKNIGTAIKKYDYKICELIMIHLKTPIFFQTSKKAPYKQGASLQPND
ncbi:hypothetical protein F8160_23450 [Bacillus sp. CH126_4D]|nr:hypothetical protein F8162_04530 [Bacillus sp. CH140a_4T]KAB2468770.1 hypothetical protein F8160_23450 [Bacillus sp. CH126_4D]